MLDFAIKLCNMFIPDLNHHALYFKSHKDALERYAKDVTKGKEAQMPQLPGGREASDSGYAETSEKACSQQAEQLTQAVSNWGKLKKSVEKDLSTSQRTREPPSAEDARRKLKKHFAA